MGAAAVRATDRGRHRRLEHKAAAAGVERLVVERAELLAAVRCGDSFDSGVLMVPGGRRRAAPREAGFDSLWSNEHVHGR